MHQTPGSSSVCPCPAQPGFDSTQLNLIQPHQEPGLDQPLDIALPDEKLAVLGQIDRAVLGLDLPGVLQHAHVDEQVSRRHQTARQVNVRPLRLVLREKIRVRVEV